MVSTFYEQITQHKDQMYSEMMGIFGCILDEEITIAENGYIPSNFDSNEIDYLLECFNLIAESYLSV